MARRPDTKAEEVSVGPLHHLEKTQALLSNLPDHGPHRAPLEVHREKPESDEKDIKMGLRAQILRAQIRVEDSDQRLGTGRFHRRLHPGNHMAYQST